MFHLEQSNREGVEIFSSGNRLNGIIPFLGDKWFKLNGLENQNSEAVFLVMYDPSMNEL
jgi:hypothetical protein